MLTQAPKQRLGLWQPYEPVFTSQDIYAMTQANTWIAWLTIGPVNQLAEIIDRIKAV